MNLLERVCKAIEDETRNDRQFDINYLLAELVFEKWNGRKGGKEGWRRYDPLEQVGEAKKQGTTLVLGG